MENADFYLSVCLFNVCFSLSYFFSFSQKSTDKKLLTLASSDLLCDLIVEQRLKDLLPINPFNAMDTDFV